MAGRRVPRLVGAHEYEEFVALCRGYAPRAVKEVYALMLSSNNDAVRLKAAELLILRGYGQPVVFQAAGDPTAFADAVRAQLAATGVAPPRNPA